MLWHGAQYHKGFFGCPFACPILQLNFLESFPFSRTCICLQAIWIFVFWICYLWQSIGNEPEIDMINRFCRQRTKTRTFLCFKCFLSGYFEYQVHLNIYQNTKILISLYHYTYKCCPSLIIIVNLQQSIYCPVPGPWITGGQRGEGGIGTMEASLWTLCTISRRTLHWRDHFFCNLCLVVSLREFIDMQTHLTQIAVLEEWWAEEFSQDWSHRTLYRLLGKRGQE